jgi:hypothetical protein
MNRCVLILGRKKSREFSAAALGEIHTGRIIFFGRCYTQRAEIRFHGRANNKKSIHLHCPPPITFSLRLKGVCALTKVKNLQFAAEPPCGRVANFNEAAGLFFSFLPSFGGGRKEKALINNRRFLMTKCQMQTVPASDSETGRDELYIVFDGRRVAKRGYPDTPQAGTWVPIEPGFNVFDDEDMTEIVVEQSGVRVQ